MKPELEAQIGRLLNFLAIKTGIRLNLDQFLNLSLYYYLTYLMDAKGEKDLEKRITDFTTDGKKRKGRSIYDRQVEEPGEERPGTAQNLSEQAPLREMQGGEGAKKE